MDLNQTTIQLKPMYPHSHISLYNAPVLSAAMPSMSGLNIVGAQQANGTTNITSNGQLETNNNNNNNFNSLASNIQTTVVTNSAHLVPVTTNNVCLNNLQIQQIQQMQQQTFGQNQFNITTTTRNSNGHQNQNHHHHHQQQQQEQQQQQTNHSNSALLQIQITAPTLLSSSGSLTGANRVLTSDTTNGQDSMQQIVVAGRSNLIPDTNSSLSNESAASTLSETINPSELVNSSSTATSGSSSPLSSVIRNNNNNFRGGSSTSKKEHQMDIGVNSSINGGTTNYVNLAKASCSASGASSSAISMKLNSSDSSCASHRSSNLGKGFKCQICNRDFTQKGNLKTHLMTHSGERPYECQTCGKNFTQKGNLDTHVKIHTETKDHKCQFCDRGFTQRGNLKTHIRSIHTKEKPYACGRCGKSFSQKGNMLTHFRTHDKESRFPCNICGKTFSQKGNLKTHQQRHGRGSER